MGCTASKDAVETNRKSLSASQIGRGMTMPVQAQGESNNGYHMVALTSSTYGILNADTPKIDVSSMSSHDAFYEKLKHFEVPDEMVAKPWSEVSLILPKIPPPTRIDSPRRTDNLRRMDSPRLHSRGLDSPRLHSRGLDSPRQTGSFRGIDSPRQRGSFGRTDSPRRLPSQATKNDHETIDTWELMDGLDEDGKTRAKLKLKPVERIPRSPVIKPFERSITFSTIHTLSELDSADPSKAIAPGPAGDFSNGLIAVDSGGKENTNPVRTITRSVSSPMVPKRDEITVRLTPSSPSLAAKVAAPSDDPSRPRQPTVAPMLLTPEANAAIQEVSDAVSKIPSPASITVGKICWGQKGHRLSTSSATYNCTDECGTRSNCHITRRKQGWKKISSPASFTSAEVCWDQTKQRFSTSSTTYYSTDDDGTGSEWHVTRREQCCKQIPSPPSFTVAETCWDQECQCHGGEK